MAIKSEQLETIFQETTERFQNDRYVTVSPVAGKSSEQYKVTYNVTGVVQKEDKSIQETRTHSISLTIPFGFPHFPPNCKPLSPTFHPDFDEAAICIGDFWTREKTLSDVIIQIGRMISGEIHSKENAFNEEALVWYQENSEKLPFEIVNFSSQPTSSDDLLELNIEEEEEEEEDFEIDVLDDDDFDSDIESDFDFMNIEEVEFPEEAPADLPVTPVDSEPTQLDTRELLKQNRFYELERILHNTPHEASFDGRANIEQQISNALARAKKLQREAEEYELKGNPAKALALFEEVQSLVSDFPNIEENIQRTQDSLDLLGDWSPGGDDSFITDFHTNGKSEEKEEPAKNLTFFDVKSKSKLRILPLVITGSILALAAVFIYPLFTEKAQLEIAQQELDECKSFLKQGRYTSAEQKCYAALETATSFQLIFKTKEKARLAKEINEILQTPDMQQGLAGNVLYNGEYIHKSVYQSILNYQKIKEAGETYFKNKQWKEASASFQKALKLTQYLVNSGPSESIRLKNQISLSEVNAYMEEGSHYNEKQDWKNATISFQKALDAAQTLDVEKRKAITQKISPQLSETSFLQLIQQANALFTSNDWEKALSQYRKAKELTKNFELSNPILLDSLNEKIARTELYATIKSGKESFDSGHWDFAITKYGMAINLLEKNKTLLKRTNSNESRKKLSRVVLQASIIRDQQIVATQLKAKKFDKAIDKLKSIDKTITDSEFKNDEEFRTIAKEARTAIVDVKSQKLIADLTTYLMENYQELFSKNYSTISREFLKDPIVSFVRHDGNDFLFKLKCKEVGQGRPSILLMHYMYNKKSGNWKFHDISQ
jgi:ubiquitin-protein ligase/ribosomal protein L17